MKITNLVLSGSGSLLSSFAGASHELFKHIPKSDIKRIASTSGGSIFAFLLIIHRFDTAKVIDIMLKMDFSRFFDNKFGIFRDIWNLVWRGGWNEGKEIIEFLSEELQMATGRKDMTFLEFFGKFGIDLTVVTTNADLACAEYCNSANTPSLSVIEAVRRSMSIPLVFVPRKDERGTYIDGGVLDNFAIRYYDYTGKPEETLGFCFKEASEKPQRKTSTGMLGMIGAVRRCWLRPQKDTDTTGLDRTIAISDCDLSGLDPLDNNEKMLLINAGETAVKEWIKRNGHFAGQDKAFAEATA